MVHRREIGGEEVVFGNQGALYLRAMTWWDHDTGSVWTQPRGEAIAGPRKGERLELVPSRLTRWDEWRRAHPDTLALDAHGGHSGFDLKDMAVVVDLGDEAVAFPVPEVAEAGVANETVAGVEVAVVVVGNDWTVFSRRLDDRILMFARRDGDLVDRRTGTVWDPVRGLARSGPLKGTVLDQLPGFTSFVDDFRNHFPEGRVWGAP